jgi:hypothetical protein
MGKIKAQKKTKEETVSNHLLPGYDFVMVAGQHSVCSIVRSNDPVAIDGPVLGGFHTLCADVRDIPGHPLSGFLAGDILPASLWNNQHRAACGNNNGMVYDAVNDVWCDIYLAMDEQGKLLQLSYEDYVAWGTFRGKRLLTDEEFTAAAAGSNEMTNIKDSRRPDISGGHSDTLGRRMISDIGCEDCCGALYQWLSTPWPGDISYLLFAGGYWGNAAIAGSRSRYASNYRWFADTAVGARFVSEPLIKRGARRRKNDNA